jgi:histidinol dehydrogenase
METILYPSKERWDELCKRPVLGIFNLDNSVRTILDRVKTEGDKALRDYSRKFDSVALIDIKVSEAEFEESAGLVPDKLKKAISIATISKNFTKPRLRRVRSLKHCPG